MKTIAIYHKDCNDGTTAAAVVLRKFPDAQVFPLSHGYEIEDFAPIFSMAQIGDQIFTVDCALGVNEFLEAGHKVTVIDHHIGKKEELEILSQKNKNLTYVFNNDKSGASLTWSYFFPNEEIPELIKYVEDRDLWGQKYGQDTENVSIYISMITNQPEEVLKLFNIAIDDIKKEGSIINRYVTIHINKYIEKVEPIMINIGKYKIPFYNSWMYRSELGNAFAIKHNQTVGLFSIDGNKVKISFRSLDSQNPSALDIAKIIDGGGHRNASGAMMKLADFTVALSL